VTAGKKSEGIKCFNERGGGYIRLDGNQGKKNKPVLLNLDNSILKEKDRKKIELKTCFIDFSRLKCNSFALEKGLQTMIDHLPLGVKLHRRPGPGPQKEDKNVIDSSYCAKVGVTYGPTELIRKYCKIMK
jgi:hypothetical protein